MSEYLFKKMIDYAFLIKIDKMRAGDIVALFSANFRLGVVVDPHNLVVIYKSKQVEYQTINILLHNINDLSSLTPTEVLPTSMRFTNQTS